MSIRKKFIVKRFSISDVLADLPSPQILSEPLEDIDILIVAAGFEERVLGIPKTLIRLKANIIKSVLIGQYQTNPDENAQREAELAPLLNELNKNIIHFDAESPEETYRVIHEELSSLTNDHPSVTVGLDISGGSGTFIISTMLTLIRNDRRINLKVFYATACDYHEPASISRDEPVTLWTERDLRETGVHAVGANELAPGIHHDHLPSFVIALPSMFSARMQRGLSFLGIGTLSGADESVYWILPTTDDINHKWRQSQVECSLLNMIYGSPSEDDTIPTSLPAGQWTHCDVLDYKGCARIVMTQVQEHAGTNISVIHVGTKLQALGVALALSGRREVALTKTRPQSFSADNYSTGIGQSYFIDLPDLREIARRFAAVGSLDIENS